MTTQDITQGAAGGKPVLSAKQTKTLTGALGLLAVVGAVAGIFFRRNWLVMIGVAGALISAFSYDKASRSLKATEKAFTE